MEIPQVQTIERVVHVPKIQEIVREVLRIEIVDVPVVRQVEVPKVAFQVIEEVRHVPVQQYVDIPVERHYHVPVIEEREAYGSCQVLRTFLCCSNACYIFLFT